LYKTKTDLKLSWWPTPQDYNEAVQIPQGNLNDPELKSGLVYTDAIGLPRPITGSFASVYRMHCTDKDYALRLFLRNIRDQEERYALISDFVQHDDLPYTVTFDFLKTGIKIMGEWLPALKMEWVEGEPFDDYIIENLAFPGKLGRLLTEFTIMMDDLRRAGIAHGDLQHGNIIVCGDELRLVDYDGMFVPAMIGFGANELGHRNYQHPQRTEHHFGPYLDNFSAWVIYTSVRALQIDSRLLHKLGGGDDCLLFRQADFLDPLHSAAFSALEKHDDAELRTLARFVRAQLKKDPANIAYLHLPLPEINDADLDPISHAAPGVRSGPRLVRGNLPDWLQEENTDVLVNSHSHGINADVFSAAPDVVPQSWTVPAKPAQAKWVKPTAANQANSGNWAPPQSVDQWASGQSASSQSSASQFVGHSGVGHSPSQSAAGSGQSVAGASYNAATQALHQQPTASQTANPFPPELASTTIPRKVRYNENSGHIRPEVFQAMMILNPAVWLMFTMFSTAITSDNDLRVHGVEYPATVDNVHRYQSKGAHTDVSLEYTVNGQTYGTLEHKGQDYGSYKVGNHFMIRALPSNPSITEPLDEPAGTKQTGDIGWTVLLLFINLLTELGIWYSALKARRLAEKGVPLLATIDSLKVHTGSKGEKSYYAAVTYQYSIKKFTETLSVSESEYNGLRKHATEIILCDPTYPRDIVFYKYCAYHPVMPAPPLVPLTPLSSVHTITHNPAPPSKKSLPRP